MRSTHPSARAYVGRLVQPFLAKRPPRLNPPPPSESGFLPAEVVPPAFLETVPPEVVPPAFLEAVPPEEGAGPSTLLSSGLVSMNSCSSLTMALTMKSRMLFSFLGGAGAPLVAASRVRRGRRLLLPAAAAVVGATAATLLPKPTDAIVN